MIRAFYEIQLATNGLAEVWHELRGNLVLGLITCNPFDGLTTLEQHQRRNTHDIIAHQNVRVGIRIQFADTYLALVFISDLLNQRPNHLTRGTPLSPEVDQPQRCAFQASINLSSVNVCLDMKRLQHN